MSARPIAPIIMVKFTPRFEETDYSVILDGAFDITNPLQAIQQEAGAKGCGVVVQISLVPLDELMEDTISDERKPDNERSE